METQNTKKRKHCADEWQENVQCNECDVCKHDRKSRALVVQTAADERWASSKFSSAPAIFPNNDVKYDVNKLRALNYAQMNRNEVVYVPAKDTPSAEALRERPDLPAQKKEWLKRHDKESGDLYGVLPLCIGMPVALTDHVDRSLNKNLLRGRIGTVESIVYADNDTSISSDGVRVTEKLPKVIYVRFQEENGRACSWTLPSLKEPGLYPITAKRSVWFLDKGRKHPVLRIIRQQFPLAPAFATTSHAAQGQTFRHGAIVDLSIGGSTSPLSSYVALTRVRSRKDLLIYRPFDREPFTKGERPGPALLFKAPTRY